MNKRLIAVVIALSVVTFVLFQVTNAQKRVLIFSHTAGFRHSSIEDGQRAIFLLGEEAGILVDSTENPDNFNDDFLSEYDAVIFLSTTGDMLNEGQQVAFQRFIQAGGGYLGIHAASDAEYNWPWYGQLVGGYFVNHPSIQEASLIVENSNHPATAHLPSIWTHTDEWYNIRMVNDEVNVLISIDETSYDPGNDISEGDSHPMVWYHQFDGGRSLYAEPGHTAEAWLDDAFLQMILGGIQWVTDGPRLNYEDAGLTPNEESFTQNVLMTNLREPMEVAPLPDGRVLFIERHGSLHLVDPSSGASGIAAEVPVFSEMEDGLLGLALDPEFEENGWLYLFYSAPGDEPKQHLSRFHFNGFTLELDTERILLEIPTQRDECCHAGGSLEFGPDGSLYISTGDDTNPFASDGYSPSDERAGRSPWDAQRTSANTMDLRGKILRVKPEADGTISILEGNLFSDPAIGRPEIFVMGNRNPFRISLDSKTGWLYWGEVGPDASDASDDRGPAGHDEINQARSAGFFGWPYFIGDNKVYRDWDFAAERAGPPREPMAPINDSPHNTGATALPPAQPAFIWYPYGDFQEFPLLENGGRTAMAGPVFHASDQESSSFPAYFEDKLFIYEWMRHRIFVVTMDQTGAYRYMERFLPSKTFSRPMDMAFGQDGALYMLEYGEAWNTRNPEAQLSQITLSK